VPRNQREANPVHDKPIDELLGDDALAARMGVSATHVWHLSARGVIPKPFKLGRVARWHWPSVLRALEKTQGQSDMAVTERLADGRKAARERKAVGDR
jgi:predicted DNA-binding transcriptional regulator AlpA